MTSYSGSSSRRQVVLANLFVLMGVALAATPTCQNAPVPFSTSLVGKTFARVDDCHRPSASGGIDVYWKSFLYTPVRSSFAFQCDEKYVLRYRRGNKKPFVIYFPKISGNHSMDVLQNEAFCKEEHPKHKKKYFVTGSTRRNFIKAIRTMVVGLKEVRDFGCCYDQGLTVNCVGKSYENVGVDGIVSYLIGIGYSNKFCAE